MIRVDGCIGRDHGARKDVVRVAFGSVVRLEEAFFQDSYVEVFPTLREVARTGQYVPSGASMARSIAGAIESFDPFWYDDYQGGADQHAHSNG